jgi:hypothetical protein
MAVCADTQYWQPFASATTRAMRSWVALSMTALRNGP